MTQFNLSDNPLKISCLGKFLTRQTVADQGHHPRYIEIVKYDVIKTSLHPFISTTSGGRVVANCHGGQVAGGLTELKLHISHGETI